MTITTAQRSRDNVFKNLNLRGRCVNGIYKGYKDAPMHRREVKDEETGTVRVKRSGRILKAHNWKVAMAMASSAVSQDAKYSLSKFGVEAHKESKMRPFEATISVAAAYSLENFISSLAKEVMLRARVIKETIGHHERNHKSIIQMAIDEVKKQIVDPSTGAATTITVMPFKLARKRKSGETEAPGEKIVEDVADDDNDEEEEEDAGAEEE